MVIQFNPLWIQVRQTTRLLDSAVSCATAHSSRTTLLVPGAQSTIMTLACAQACGIDHLIDTRFEGQAVGVGTGKIMGRIHLAEMKIGSAHFPVTIVS